MSDQEQRYLSRFDSISGALTTTFPKSLYEAESLQPLKGEMAALMNASGGHDYQGLAPWAKGVATHSVRFAIVPATVTALDTSVDAMRAALYRAGTGKLYSVDKDGLNPRWIYAKISAMPARRVSGQSWKAQSEEISFISPDPTWYGDALSITAVRVAEAYTQSPAAVTWNNPGNARSRLTILATANASGGYGSGFTIANATTAQSIATTRPSTSTNSRVQLDGPRQRVRYSTDGGTSWIDDYASATIPATQVDFAIDLEPGDNTITITVPGTADVTFTVTGYACWQ